MASQDAEGWEMYDEPRPNTPHESTPELRLPELVVNGPQQDTLQVMGHDGQSPAASRPQSAHSWTIYDTPLPKVPLNHVTDFIPPEEPPEDSQRGIWQAANSLAQETPSRPGSLRRELHQIHIFLITISAVIGMGLYVRTGTVHHLGGSAAVIYSYAFLGALTLMVMNNLAIMLSIWPIAGSLIIFVQKFVDEEVGTMVGVLYWLTYVFSFAGLTGTIYSLAEYLVDSNELSASAAIAISVISSILPIFFNLMDIRIFRQVELFFGSIKLLLAIAIIFMMNIMNPNYDEFNTSTPTTAKRDSVFLPGGTQNSGWFGVLMTSIYVTSFAFVGVEAVAVTAQEVKFENDRITENNSTDRGHNADSASGRSSDAQSVQSDSGVSSKSPFRGPALLIPIVTTLIYLWGGWIVTQNITWDDKDLPTLQWEQPEINSIFVVIGTHWDDHYGTSLRQALTGLLILNIFSTSSTTLYISSRSLFGLAYSIKKKNQHNKDRWWVKLAHILSRKHRFDVPWVAVLVSAFLFWLPWVGFEKGSKVSVAIDVIVEMGSVSCVLVWAFESFAAFRFYGCYKTHFNKGTPSVPDIRSIVKIHDRTWYLFHRITAALSASLCICLILVGGIMTTMNNPVTLQGIASFLVIGVMISLTIIFKAGKKEHSFWSRKTLKLVDFSDTGKVTAIFEYLDDQDKDINVRLEREELRKRDFGGIFDSKWFTRNFIR